MLNAQAARLAVGLIVAILIGLIGSTPAGSAAQAAQVNPDWGSVSAKNATLKRGCHNYSVRYTVRAPATGDWDLSVSVIRKGRAVWFGYLFEGANPATGVTKFRLCSYEHGPGRYRLKAFVSLQDGDEVSKVALPKDIFKLRKPRKRGR